MKVQIRRRRPPEVEIPDLVEVAPDRLAWLVAERYLVEVAAGVFEPTDKAALSPGVLDRLAEPFIPARRR